MKTEKNSKKVLIIIVVLSILVLGLGGYIVYDKIISNQNIDSSNNNNKTGIEQEIKQQETYKSYKIGDSVNLLDSSNWNVLESSTENDEFITLLSDDNVNKDKNIKFKDASTYISTTYRSNLITKLNATSNDIKETRLLTLEDISKLSGIEISKLTAGTSLENNVTPEFIYHRATITSEIDEYDCPTMICGDIDDTHTDRPGRICEGTQTNIFPIRPVIKISKNYIQQ